MVRLARSRSIALAAAIGLAVSVIGAGIFAPSAARAADVFRVAYAGSMGAVMDQFIGPAFPNAMMFLILVLMLLVRPSGLLGNAFSGSR